MNIRQHSLIKYLYVNFLMVVSRIGQNIPVLPILFLIPSAQIPYIFALQYLVYLNKHHKYK